MSISKFYDIEARKIIADGEKVPLFTKHPGALGAFREARLRQYISEHVASRYEVTSGFITDHDPAGDAIYNHSSRQIDCLIHEPATYAPLLRSTDFTVVVPKTVAAVVEVKSNLTLSKQRVNITSKVRWKDSTGEYAWSGSLYDALHNIKSAIDVLSAANVSRDHYFAGIIGYLGGSIEQFPDAMSSGELWKQLEINNIDQMPCSICIFDDSWFSFSAFPWVDNPETNGIGDSDPTQSYLIEGLRATEGSSLQMFTAQMDHTLSVSRQSLPHTVGGLRSGKGYAGKVNNHLLDLPSPRQHLATL